MQSMTEQLLALGINPDTLSIVDGNETPIDISDEEISDTVSAAVGDIFSMLNATGIQSMRDDIAWGIVNSFAKACEKAEDHCSCRIGETIRAVIRHGSHRVPSCGVFTAWVG